MTTHIYVYDGSLTPPCACSYQASSSEFIKEEHKSYVALLDATDCDPITTWARVPGIGVKRAHAFVEGDTVYDLSEVTECTDIKIMTKK